MTEAEKEILIALVKTDTNQGIIIRGRRLNNAAGALLREGLIAKIETREHRYCKTWLAVLPRDRDRLKDT